jgi:hypothetical protein
VGAYEVRVICGMSGPWDTGGIDSYYWGHSPACRSMYGGLCPAFERVVRGPVGAFYLLSRCILYMRRKCHLLLLCKRCGEGA